MTRVSVKLSLLIVAVIVGFSSVILFWQGHPLVCECGYIKFWHGVTYSSENSQHISDWYTFSHIIHGFVFYWLSWLIGRRRGWSIGFSFILAILVESSWEVFENSDFIINRYREATISLDYYGDSVLNSATDIIFAGLGFWLAARLPVWSTIFLIIAMELFVGYFIRDNLILNIIMLIYPFEGIRIWQSGG